MNKDIGLKLKLIRYFVANHWYPHLEADMYCSEGISNPRKLITDIDAMALVPSNFGELIPLFGDCKTLRNQSPISRVLWMNGLMQMKNAKKGIILLNKKIERDHKQAAADFNVSLLSEDDFEQFASRTCIEYKTIDSPLCDGDLWDEYYGIYKKFNNLEPAIKFVKNDYWNISDNRLRLRKAIVMVKEIKKELNPDNKMHIALLMDLIGIFSISINNTVLEIFNQYLLPETKETLSYDLKIYLWGGIDQYQYWNKLYKYAGVKNQDEDLSLPEWEDFLQLVRQCLEEPYATKDIPLFMRELAFKTIAISKHKDSENCYLSKKLISKNEQLLKFSILCTKYICKSSKLPSEFEDYITKEILKANHL